MIYEYKEKQFSNMLYQINDIALSFILSIIVSENQKKNLLTQNGKQEF